MAQAPATWGVASEVPDPIAIRLSGKADSMSSPGASRERKLAEFDNVETRSPAVLEPTLTADEMHAGAASAFALPSFPDAIVTAMPAETRLSIAAFVAALSASQDWVVP